jgi:uncharacterized OB-fold protein
MAQIPIVDYLDLEHGEPHLVALECQHCGALTLRHPIQCGNCFTKGPFEPKSLATTGTLRAFTVVKRGAIGDGFISAIVDFDSGGNAKANLLNGDLENFENNKLGEPVRLVTYTVDTDDDGNEAVAFGFEKV